MITTHHCVIDIYNSLGIES